MNKLFLIFSAFFVFSSAVSAIEDDTAALLKNKHFKKPETNLKYNYSSIERTAVKISIIETAKSKNRDIYEKKPLLFKTKNETEFKNTAENMTVKAGAVHFAAKGMNGVPACIMLDDFEIEGIEQQKTAGAYKKCGISFTALVLPLKYALTVLFPLGSFTNLIPGTDTKITPDDDIIIYYYPEWNRR